MLKIFLVRPHPPAMILAQSCPTPEAYRYNWQPMALKFIAYYLQKAFEDSLDIKIWHLMDYEDDRKFKEALIAQEPDIVIFSDLDILVNEIDQLASMIKRLRPQTWTIVGGKHTSLLREGDQFPYQAIDFAIRGDGMQSLQQIITARRDGHRPWDCPAVVCVDTQGKVTGPLSYEQRVEIAELDGIKMQSFCVEGHSAEEYLAQHQIYPALIPEKPRTATLFAGSGCPYQCTFCQSSIEHGRQSQIVKVRPGEKIAEEIAWLVKKHHVNNVFSLEPNLNLENWLKTYDCLEQLGIDFLPVSGFVRADNILETHRKGILAKLVQKGMRVLSVGLDIPLGSGKDIYHKAFSLNDLMECLAVCEDLGIILLGTFIGDPRYTFHELKNQLRLLEEIPIAAVDIRLSIALRNTQYYHQVLPWLVYRPDEDRSYFDRQNYRYQTVTFPDKIQPRQTYELVRSFYQQFLMADKHLDYVGRFARRYPESRLFFRNQYAPVLKDMTKRSAKLQELVDYLEID